MPFSREKQRGFLHFKQKIKQSIQQKINDNVTLQVRIHFKGIFDRKQSGILSVKKAFLFPSVRDWMGKSAAGSLTMEAALLLPLLIFAITAMLLPMKIMNTERKIQAGLEAAGEEISRYVYLGTWIGTDKAGYEAGFGLGEAAIQAYARQQVLQYADTDQVQNVRLLRSSVLKEDDRIDLVVDYEIRLPFPVLGLSAVSRTARSCRRAWTGLDGKDYSGETDGEDETDEIVYVGKDSTRYHRNRNCHYLANRLRAVSAETVSELRNASGGKYYACGRCGEEAGAVVYIMPEGENYHGSLSCSAIQAYVRAVKLSEVRHLGPCSYCSG